MAKKLIKHISNIFGIKAPDANGYYDPSVYVSEPAPEPASTAATKAEPPTRELTRVERYLASKNPEPQAAKPEIAPAASSELTGVAKYLARLQQEADEQAAAEAEALANMTGVARYLAQKEGRIPAQAVTAPAPAPEPVEEVDISKLTGVERYLALQKQGAAKPAAVKPAPALQPKAEEKPKAKAKPAIAEKPAATEEPVVEAESAPEPQAEEAAPQASAGNDVIDLAANAEQCQAATTKGTQCRRKTGLETVEKTIDGQRYLFAVCGQHNNDSFTPVAGLVE